MRSVKRRDNLARFDRNRKPINYKGAPTTSGPNRVTEKTSAGLEKTSAAFNARSGVSYRDAFIGSKDSLAYVKTVNIPDNPSMYLDFCKGRSALAIASSMEVFGSLKMMLRKGGLDNAVFNLLGGLKVMITFNDKNSMDKFISVSDTVWKNHFTSVVPWNGQDIPFERTAKLRIRGVPFLLKDASVYELVGKAVGVRVLNTEYSLSWEDVSEGSCMVIVQTGKWIEEEICIKWKGKSYRVWVSEIEMSDIAGRMNSLGSHTNVSDEGGEDQGSFSVGVGPSKELSRKRARLRSPSHASPTMNSSHPDFHRPTPSSFSSFLDLNTPPNLKSTVIPESNLLAQPSAPDDGVAARFTTGSNGPLGNAPVQPGTNMNEAQTDTIIEREVEETMNLGNDLGFGMTGFKESVREIVNGEGDKQNHSSGVWVT